MESLCPLVNHKATPGRRKVYSNGLLIKTVVPDIFRNCGVRMPSPDIGPQCLFSSSLPEKRRV